jgi:hypothetical protein
VNPHNYAYASAFYIPMLYCNLPPPTRCQEKFAKNLRVFVILLRIVSLRSGGGTAATTNEKLRPFYGPQLFYPAKSDFDFYLLPITG